MSDLLNALLPLYGAALVGAVTFLSCLILPLPAAIVMMAAGALAVRGTFPLSLAMAAAMGGAAAGDMAGYTLGRQLKSVLLRLRAGKGPRAALVSRAMALVRARGAVAVFLSRWALSPLGPWVNFAAGAARMARGRFVAAMLPGRAIWTIGYVGIGAGLSDRLRAVSPDLEEVTVIGLATLAVGLAVLLARRALSKVRTPSDP